MPEVNTCFEQLLHGDRGHWPPSWIASGLTFVWPGLNPLTRGFNYQRSGISGQWSDRRSRHL